MKERILEFLQKENKTSAQFAEEIGVQPSGISHIVSGRNNPSLDFVLKMLERYPYLSTEWLLFGKGSMYKDQHYGTLFDLPTENNILPETSFQEKNTSGKIAPDNLSSHPSDAEGIVNEHINQKVKKIVFFFEDGTFEEYLSRK
jgi:transcriptional regulator with XRE-family HTH domain